MQESKIYIPKLIFLDVSLPDSNGCDFCIKLKSSEVFKKIIVYYFTGIAEAEVVVKTVETKTDGYLKKPLDLSDFIDIFELVKHYSLT